MKKVSIIVPVHNASKYLVECVESVLKQDYDAWELFLIENGSTDDSREICERYAAACEKIQVLCLNASGVSAARNAGLAVATGEFIVFADADDYLAENTVLSEMVQLLEQSDADIVVGNYQRLWNGKILPAGRYEGLSEMDSSSAEFRFQGFFSVGVLSYVWCKMYRTSFIKKYSVHFGEYNYAEDKMFNFLCCLYGAGYVFLDKAVYVYRKNDVSISNTFRKDSAECWLRIAQDLQEILEKENWEEEYGDLVAYTIFFASFFDAKMMYLHSGKKISEVKKVLCKYRNHTLSKKYFKEFAGGKRLKRISSLLWRVMIWGFSVAMYCRWYLLLEIGIKLLIDLRIDERLSDTGLREEGNKK